MKYLKYYNLLSLFVILSCSKADDIKKEPSTPQETTVEILFPEALFTDVSQVSQRHSSTKIMNRLIELIDATPENSDIHISISTFTYPSLVNALLRANQRNVSVKVMMDASSENSQAENQTTITTLENRFYNDSQVVLVNNDVRDIAINHNKFVLFSEVSTSDGEVQDVIFQTSHNFTDADTRKVQDAVILSNKGLYNAFLAYWSDMEERADSGMMNYSYQEYVTDDLAAYFLPKRRYGGFYGDDTIIEVLDGIDDPSQALIRIGMSLWTDTRLNIVDKLSDLVDEGAQVEVIVKPSVGDKIFEGLQELEKKGAYLKAFTYTNIHSKFMLIEGSWRGEASKVIVTGSHNFTGNALRYNNEVILMLNNSPLYEIYDQTFEELKEIDQ